MKFLDATKARDASLVVRSHDERDLRLGQVIIDAREAGGLRPGDCVLVGFPCDEGVTRNAGRPGAAKGPAEIRRYLYRMLANAGERGVAPGTGRILDAGDVRCEGCALEDWQERLGSVVAEILSAEAVPVVLGGGHETSFGHFLGYVPDQNKVSIINIDAHHDVRVSARATSGTPFRQAHDHASGLLASYQILGAQPQAISAPYLTDLAAMGARVAFRGEIASPGAAQVAREALDRIPRDSSILITLDLDAVDQAFAPGVSAPCTNGLFPQELLDLLGVLLADRRVSSFDVVELNPAHDWDGQTARLAALAIFRALAMFTRRRD